MQTHHISQEADGGPNTLDNCIPLCLECHGKAGSYNPKHPIGRKFSAEELRRHRDIWFEFVKAHPERINEASDPFSELSAAAVELLTEAAKEPQGKIWRFKLFRGTRIFTNNRDYVEKDNPRSRALWEGALNELVKSDLVEYGEQFFPLTATGYAVADQLTSKRCE